MSKLKLSTLLIAGAVLSFLAQSANAEDFNITIPVEVSSLPPNIDGMLLACWVYTDAGGNIGIGRARIEISGGAYRGSATLRFNASAGQDPATATKYECQGSFTGTESGSTVHYFASGGVTDTRFPLAAGAPFRLGTGQLPLPR